LIRQRFQAAELFHAVWTLPAAIGSATSPCKLGNIDFQLRFTFSFQSDARTGGIFAGASDLR